MGFQTLASGRETARAWLQGPRGGCGRRRLLGGLLAHCGLLVVWGIFVPEAWTPAVLGQSGDELEQNSREHLIKAAFLFNFGRYVQWPAEASPSTGPLVIGVLGSPPFGRLMEQVSATKTIEGRTIVVRHLASMADYQPCQILFITAGASAADKDSAIQKTQGKPVLLVGEESGLAENGVVMNFFTEDNRIRFEINAEAAKRRQLRISSKLLSLGKLVGQ